MDFTPTVNATLTISGVTYTFTEHPAAKGMPYGQSGRRATVYQIRAANGGLFAIKIFTLTFRSARVADGAERLKPFTQLPGMQVCDRQVITPEKNAELLQKYENLLYAVVMPWVYGETWQEFILGGRVITEEQSRAVAQSFAHVLREMEARQIAHCDLSGPNVLLPGFNSATGAKNNSLVALVDVEDLYAPQLARPEKLPAGSSGYAHSTSPVGVWQEDGDRFSGAVLLAEMLGWCDEQVRQIAYGEQYFDLDEMQQNSERYQVLSNALRRHWGAEMAALLGRAWESKQLSECPRLGEWSALLGAAPTALEGVVQASQARPAAAPVPETPAQRLARAAIERAQAWNQIGQTDKAVSELEDAYRLNPETVGKPLANTYLQRGEGKERTGDLQGALADYQKALSFAPPGGMRDELVTIVAEVNHKIELARSSQQVGTEKCPHCQRDVLPNVQACPYCGFRFVSANPTVAMQRPVPVPMPQPRRKTQGGNKFWIVAGGVSVGLCACLALVLVGFFALGGFQSAPASLPATSVPPPQISNTAVPQATNIVTSAPVIKASQTADPTALPGQVTMPITKMSNKIPWLSYDQQAIPGTDYIGFILGRRPFDKLAVRQALAAAVDRRKLSTSAKGYMPATTFTPAEVLGLYLYNEVGIPFDMERARVLLTQAGYPSGQGFPPVKMLVYKMEEKNANELVAMWQSLGIQSITVETITGLDNYLARLKDGSVDMFYSGWLADYIDPDNFLNVVFHSGSKENYPGFTDAEFDSLVEEAAKSQDVHLRQALYVQAERILTEKQAAIIPLYYYQYTKPTPAAAASAVPDTTTFFDDFSTPNKTIWPEDSNEDYFKGFSEGGKYVIAILNPGKQAGASPNVPINAAALTDVVVEFTATIVDGWESTAGYYQVSCHVTGDGWYLVDFQNGYYAVDYYDAKNKTHIPLLKDDWVKTTAIQQYDNRVKVSCIGSTITVWVNDQLLVQVSDPQARARAGQVWLVVGLFDRPSPNGVKVLFDDFRESIP